MRLPSLSPLARSSRERRSGNLEYLIDPVFHRAWIVDDEPPLPAGGERVDPWVVSGRKDHLRLVGDPVARCRRQVVHGEMEYVCRHSFAERRVPEDRGLHFVQGPFWIDEVNPAGREVDRVLCAGY